MTSLDGRLTPTARFREATFRGEELQTPGPKSRKHFLLLIDPQFFPVLSGHAPAEGKGGCRDGGEGVGYAAEVGR